MMRPKFTGRKEVAALWGGVLAFMLFTVTINSGAQEQNSWSVNYNGLGTFSSPRVTDLNGDGTGDIVFGAGREEFKACDSAVMAVDGRNGKMLWHVSAKDQVF